MNDTIAAIATAHGVGSISIIRLSGKNALSLAFLLSHRTNLTPRHATLTKIYVDSEFIDDAILIYFKAPASFTGEDVVEFQTHGGFAVASIILDELIRLGARLAMPGEFSKRAFLNQKTDLAKLEGIQGIINAKSQSAAKIIARAINGDLEKFIEQIRTQLVQTLAYVETSIDYADDDLPSDIMQNIFDMLNENTLKLKRIVEISNSKKGLIEGFKIAIVGKPNVGKSSILNALLAYERAIVSNEAGTTRDRVEESLNIGTHLVRIIDTAGIRKNAGEIENIGISYSIKAIDDADIILAVFDGSNEADEQDERILEILNSKQKQIFYILNKSDLECKNKILNDKKHLKISTKNSMSELVGVLERYLNSQQSSEIILNSTRQINLCNIALKSIVNANNLLSESELELFAYELNKAILSIAEISRPFERTEILDEMFSSFCLGK
jgi:tRNA modification GTPase trmE